MLRRKACRCRTHISRWHQRCAVPALAEPGGELGGAALAHVAVFEFLVPQQADLFAAESTTYTEFSGAQAVNNQHTSAVYAGQSAKTSGGAIQLRSQNSNSGIVSTTSGGKIASVTIEVASGSKTIDVYGSNTPYTSAADLYATTGNSNQGTKLGSLSASGSIAVTGDYQYIGIRSNNGAVYISSITIYWK